MAMFVKNHFGTNSKSCLPFLLLFFSFCFLPNLLLGQKATTNYQYDKVYLKYTHYYKNGLYYPHLFGTKYLKDEMTVSPEAVIEYSKFEKKRNVTFVSMFLGAGLGAVAMYADLGNESTNVGLMSAALGCDIVAITFGVKSIKSAKRAVKLRNDFILP